MVSATSNYMEYWLFLTYVVTGCVSISVFASIVGISISITSFGVGLKVCAVNVRFTKYKSKILKKKIKHDKIVLLAKYIIVIYHRSLNF